MMNNNKNTVLPCLVGRYHKDQMMTAKPTIIERYPEIMKLGMSVKASSVPKAQNLCASPIAWITSPSVAVFPCKNSKKPWLMPLNPKITAMVVAIIRVAFRV